MGVFDDLNLFGDWIQVVDEQNPLTIENYGYDTGVVEGTTGNHCVKCVAVNECWFKNEKGKKPEKASITGLQIIDKILNGLTPGLYHPYCHCEERPIETPSEETIQLIIPPGKIDYMFSDKGDWIKAMGYYEPNNSLFIKTLLQKTKLSYSHGNYYIVNHTKYGCKINLNVDIPGINEKEGKIYKLKTNYMVFPNGKLKINTPIGGWQE